MRIVAELLEHGNLTDGRAGDPVVAVVDLDLLHSNDMAIVLALCLVDDSVGALAKLRDILELVNEFLGSLEGAASSTRHLLAVVLLCLFPDQVFNVVLGRIHLLGFVSGIDEGCGWVGLIDLGLSLDHLDVFLLHL